MLNSKLQSLKDRFGITLIADWQAVTPAWVLSQDGCGPKTLDYLRMLLAAHGFTLKGDRTPEYWKQHLGEVQISDVLANEPLLDDIGQGGGDRGVMCPFTVLIDTAEQHPFGFQGFRTDSTDAGGPGRPLIVQTEFRSLGRFPDSMGDYSLDSGVGRCHVERKSIQDAHGTFLGWTKRGEDCGRRERFEQELGRLSEIEAGLVVVECSFQELIANAPEFGRKTAAQNSRTLHRSVLAWLQDYSVSWIFSGSRRRAEQDCFCWLKRWHRKDQEARKAEEKRLAKIGEKIGQVSDEPQRKSMAEVEKELAAL